MQSMFLIPTCVYVLSQTHVDSREYHSWHGVITQRSYIVKGLAKSKYQINCPPCVFHKLNFYTMRNRSVYVSLAHVA
jgi:hypothetical protein